MDPAIQAAATNAVAMTADRTAQLTGYIVHHALYHARELDSWNLPFLHVPLLDYLHLDQVMILLSAVLLVLLAWRGARRHTGVPHGLSNVIEAYVLAIRDQIAIPYMGREAGKKFTPFFCTLFAFILFMNVLGLAPIFTVATSNINVTGALALITLGMMIGCAIWKKGWGGFLKTFVVPGVPLPLLLLLTPLEVISMFTKAFALMVRLAANMLSGHIVIFSLLGMVYLFGWYAFPVAALAVGIFFFELFVAAFQAYIFTLLSAVFIGQMMMDEHAETET